MVFLTQQNEWIFKHKNLYRKMSSILIKLYLKTQRDQNDFFLSRICIERILFANGKTKGKKMEMIRKIMMSSIL